MTSIIDLKMVLWFKMKDSKLFEKNLVKEIIKLMYCESCNKIVFIPYENSILNVCQCDADIYNRANILEKEYYKAIELHKQLKACNEIITNNSDDVENCVSDYKRTIDKPNEIHMIQIKFESNIDSEEKTYDKKSVFSIEWIIITNNINEHDLRWRSPHNCRFDITYERDHEDMLKYPYMKLWGDKNILTLHKAIEEYKNICFKIENDTYMDMLSEYR
jgi:hypothetical protein